MARNGMFILESICFKARGDVGPLTCYTGKSGIVVFLKAWLSDPASTLQIQHRNRIRAAAKNWNAAPLQTRKNYEAATRRASIKINGYNMWMHASLTIDGPSHVATVARQTGITLPPPPPE